MFQQFRNAALCLLLLAGGAQAQQQQIGRETPAQKEKRMEWWTNDRFGMFIHWGLYAMPARHEWVRHYEWIQDGDYRKYFELFNPDLFDPKLWAKQAKAAGMKYAVLTTKHHEGFCMFDSRFTDYKVTNTPARRDLVRQFVDAYRAEGLKVGFYYSLIDWHHPQFTIDGMHPHRPRDGSDSVYAVLNKNRDMAKYRQYMRDQITELLTQYGKIDVLWLDFSYPGKHGKGKDDWGSVELLKLIRKLQPGIIVDNRLDLGMYSDGQDFETPEQVSVEELAKYHGKAWETCQTFSGSWGYHRDENTWKSTRELLRLLIGSVSNGGNLLLNVGPTARGEFDERAQDALANMGKWMRSNNKAIYNCTFAPEGFKTPAGTMLTYNPKTKRMYVHIMEYGKTLVLPAYKGKVKYAQFLHDNSEVRFDKSDNDDVVLALPERKPNQEIPVVELVLNN